MSILAIVTRVIPLLIDAYEQLFSGFPGKGAIKKGNVLRGISDLVSIANASGSHIEGQVVLDFASTAVDSYVAVQNALGAFQHEAGSEK